MSKKGSSGKDPFKKGMRKARKQATLVPEDLQVLYEDNHLIAVNKRPGDIVQGDKTGDKPLSELVKEYLKKKYDKPGNVYLGVIHRLDRPVGGVTVFARTSKALSRMNRMFQERKVQKKYWVVVQKGLTGRGRFLHYLKKDEAKNRSITVKEGTKGAKRAELDYRVLGSSDHYTFLEITPLTGRHHQIRVQLSAKGSVIKGDVKYGFKRPNKDASIHLLARSIEFLHPVTGETLVIKADPSREDTLWRLFLEKAEDHS